VLIFFVFIEEELHH